MLIDNVKHRLELEQLFEERDHNNSIRNNYYDLESELNKKINALRPLLVKDFIKNNHWVWKTTNILPRGYGNDYMIELTSEISDSDYKFLSKFIFTGSKVKLSDTIVINFRSYQPISVITMAYHATITDLKNVIDELSLHVDKDSLNDCINKMKNQYRKNIDELTSNICLLNNIPLKLLK